MSIIHYGNSNSITFFQSWNISLIILSGCQHYKFSCLLLVKTHILDRTGKFLIFITVDSLSRIPRDSLKYFEISVPRHISDLQNWGKIIRTTTSNKYICYWPLEVRDILKILWKRGEIAPYEQFLRFSTISFYLLLDFHVKAGTRFSLRDKRLFEISEIEISRVNCIITKKFH